VERPNGKWHLLRLLQVVPVLLLVLVIDFCSIGGGEGFDQQPKVVLGTITREGAIMIMKQGRFRKKKGLPDITPGKPLRGGVGN